MSSPEQYGRFYFCVKVPKLVCPNGEIYVHADRIEIKDGCLLMLGRFNASDEERPETVCLALRDGNWHSVYAASCIDGHAVAVEHWKGEVER